MQTRWAECLTGKGEIDLSEVRQLSPAMTHNVAGLGACYGEKVLEVGSLLTALQSQMRDFIHRGPAMDAKRTIYTCGKGNGALAHARRRPLRMFLVNPAPREVYVHFYDNDETKPQLTITTHPWKSGKIWMLGGMIAEQTSHCLHDAVNFVKRFVPDENLDGLQWADFLVDRAEPQAKNEDIPGEPRIVSNGTTAVAWPIKLTLAPLLSDKILQWVTQSGLMPSHGCMQITQDSPSIAQYPWEKVKWLEVTGKS